MAAQKKYWQMTTAELAEATKEFEQEDAFLKGRQLNREERAQHARARRRGRPRVGLGAEKIRVSIERGLLARTDAYARQQGMSRSELIATCLRTVLKKRTNGG